MNRTWQKPSVVKEIERELPRYQAEFLPFECLFGRHKAEILHHGTTYCRNCYDEMSRVGKLLDP